MRNRELVFVVITVLVLSCLTLAGPGQAVKRGDDLYSEYETFARIVANVTENYVEEVDTKKLFYGAFDGMLQTLDPYSAFLPPAEKEDLEVETKGEFGGLGIEVTLDKNGTLTVIAPLEDTPAFKAGILAGDRIVRIESKSTKGLALRDAVKQLRGPKGTPVKLTVLHEDSKFEDITVIRDTIKLESIKDAHFVDEGQKIAYLRLTQFQANSAESLDDAIKALRGKGMKALVLDLRFNPGGLLPAAIGVADRFLPEGVIVSTKGRKSPEHIYRAKGPGTYPDFPLAVLISGRSASAAEIVAGAIQDNSRGVLVGMRTFGKASVQTLIKIEDGKSAIKLTTAHYYTPSGRLIHHNINDPEQKNWGIDPDIEVKSTLQDEVDLWTHWRDEHAKDIRDKNGKPKPPDAQKEAPEKKEPAPIDPDDLEPLPDKAPDSKTPGAKPKEFHDQALEAAVNALKGMLIEKERGIGAPGRPAEPKMAPDPAK